MKLTDIIISTIFKKGAVISIDNIETVITIPDTNIVANIKIKNMTVTAIKEDIS